VLIRVLLIEDSLAQRLYIKSFFVNRPDLTFEVLEAKDGAQGLALASDKQPDAILCDIHMPVMDGFEFVSRLRQNPHLSTIPVIMITSMANRDAMRKAMGNGADDYLTKPFTSQELIDAITGQLSKRKRQTEQTRASLDSLRQSVLTSLPHELQTPLTSIVSGAELLKVRGSKLSAEKRDEIVDMIYRGGQRLMRTIGRYLELIEIRSRSRVPRLDFISMDQAWLETVLRDPLGQRLVAAEQSDEAGAEADFMSFVEMQIEPAIVMMNQKDLIRIIYEIVGNALKFRDDQSMVRIIGTDDGISYWLQVENHGTDMPASFSTLLGEFMQFSRDTQEQQGIGFGLSIANALLSQNSGSMKWIATDGSPNAVKLRLPKTQSAIER
jgi:two-component system, sensor histidine kinase and response regulator